MALTMDAPDPGKTPFEKARDNLEDVLYEAPVVWSTVNSVFEPIGSELRTESNTSGASAGCMLQQASINPTSVAWDAGDKLEVVMWVRVAGMSNLDANEWAGIGAIDAQNSGWWGRDTVGDARIEVGFDAQGDVILSSSDGTTHTFSDSGVDVANDTWVHVYMRYIKGTEFVASIDGGAEQQKTSDLPTSVGAITAGKASNASGGVQIRVSGGFYRVTREGL